MTDSDANGYGKPPRKHQWKPGQSGNPRGRPKTPDSMFAHAAATLAQPARVNFGGGRAKYMDPLEAAYLKLCLMALKGDRPALFRTLKIILDVVPSGHMKSKKIQKEGFDAKRKLARMLGIEIDDNGNAIVPDDEADEQDDDS